MQHLLRLHILASGSKGNAAIVEGPEGALLIDCGISCKQVHVRAERLGVDIGCVRSTLVTHEHIDHVRGVRVFAKRHGGPFFATDGTARACYDLSATDCHTLGHSESTTIAGLHVQAFPTSHDVADPFGLRISVLDEQGIEQDALGWCTDTGTLTQEALRYLRGCRILGLETNHDVQMLREGPYPPYLQARVGGTHGHLSNDQAAQALAALVTEQTETVVGLHISQNNNTPHLAHEALASAVGTGVRVLVAKQDEPMSIR